jgi:hypothetical protein
MMTTALHQALARRAEIDEQIGTYRRPLADLSTAERAKVDAMSAERRMLTTLLVAGLKERRGKWTHNGVTYWLSRDGASVVTDDPQSPRGTTTRLAVPVRQDLESANERRFGRVGV